MDNFSKSANQLWKESNTSLSFKDWIEREKGKGIFILNKKFIGVDGFDTSKIDEVLNNANEKTKDSLNLNFDKFEDIIGINKNKNVGNNQNKFIGLNKWLLISSLLVIVGAISYNIYNKNKLR